MSNDSETPHINKDGDMPSISKLREQVLANLKEVYDPEIHINIVDLGLIYRIDISEDQKAIEIEFTLTTPGCPLADVIEEDIKKACAKVLPDAQITPMLVWTPMWNVDFMSEDARLELGFPI